MQFLPGLYVHLYAVACTWVENGGEEMMEKERNERSSTTLRLCGVVNFLAAIVRVAWSGTGREKSIRRLHRDDDGVPIAAAHREMLFECYSRS